MPREYATVNHTVSEIHFERAIVTGVIFSSFYMKQSFQNFFSCHLQYIRGAGRS